jgi:hypothetical protein
LTIEVGSDPISGSVRVNEGVPQQFSGWIELVAAIESARDTGSSAGGESLEAVQGANGRRV